MPDLFSPEDKERIRYHLGYLGVTDAATVEFGIPASRQTLFIVELAMQLIMTVSYPRVLSILRILDNTECNMVKGQELLAADSLGSLKIRQDQIDRLEHEYNRWSARLADIFGVPRYLYSLRFNPRPFGRATAGTVRIQR